MNFLQELKRRKVIRTIIAYLAGAFVVAQAVELLVSALHLPGSVTTVVVAGLLVALPLVIGCAWAFDITPEGIERTSAAGETARATLRWQRVGLGAVASLLTLFAAVGFLETVARPAEASDSVVVLPFENLSGDTEQDYLVEGMHDALIGELAQIGALRVISRTSALQYKSREKSIPDIARELNVRTVVEATMTRFGDSVRVRVKLVDPGSSERSLWTQVYNRALADLTIMPREAALGIVTALRVPLLAGEAKQLADARRQNPDAYEAYLRGRFHWFKLNRRDVDKALEYFQLALEKEPNYALAYTGVATVWMYRAQYGQLHPGEAYAKARIAGKKALELDPNLAEAHEILAVILTGYDWKWAEAETEYLRAIELNSNLASARVFYSYLLTCIGREREGEAQIKRALELDPHNTFFQWMLGAQLLWRDRYDEAVKQLQTVLQQDPNSNDAHVFLMAALHQLGRYEDVMALRRKRLAQPNSKAQLAVLESGYAKGGYRQAVRNLAEFNAARSDTMYVNPWRVAVDYAYAGDSELAIDWLEKGIEARSGQMLFTSMHPAFDPLHSNPRFQKLMRRLKLPT